MIGFKLDQAKSMFFDTKKVKSATDRATRKVLSRFGAFVRKTARWSIRRRKKSSKPGHPPSAHSDLLKKIFFVYDSSRRSVIIGPIRLNKPGNAPEALEYGGASRVTSGRRGRRKSRTVRIAARPFMQPAFMKEKPKLQGMWANSIR
jgi:hypothetical protein